MQSIDYIDYNGIDNLIPLLEQQINVIAPSNNESDTYILDKNKKELSLIEKFVYDNALHQLTRINKNLNNNDIYIEFWFKREITYNNINHTCNGLYNFHVDKDENMYKQTRAYKNPILSNITYLNDSTFPLLLTDINNDIYMFKEFNENNRLEFIFPVKGKSITFDGSLIHGVADPFKICNADNTIHSRVIIVMNLWDNHKCNISNYANTHTNREYYDRDIPIFRFKSKDCINETFTINTDNMLSYDFFNELLYNRNLLIAENILTIMRNNINKSITNFKIINGLGSNITNNYDPPCLKDELEHIDCCIQTNSQISINTRFRQRFIYNNIFSSHSCKWIIHEAENYAITNGGWLQKRHVYHPTVDLEVENIKPIFNYVMFKMTDIIDRIKESYCIDSHNLNIIDLFIVKYNSKDGQSGLEKHLDGCHLSINIALSDSNTYEGGGVKFFDGIKYKSNIGDAIVHSGQIYHSGIDITNGIRYVLVAFIKIHLNA